MKGFAGAALGAALLLGGVTGCSSHVGGTVVAKEHEARNCEKRSGVKCVRWDPEEYELTVRLADGSEQEWVVSRDTYDSVNVGDTGTWKGIRD